MKILHVLHNSRAEGTPKLVLDWLQINEYEQEVLFLNKSGELFNDFEKLKIPLFYNNSFIPSVANSVKIIQLVKSICVQRRPTIVIVWVMGFSHLISLGVKLGHCKNVLVHCGNLPGKSFLHKYISTYICFLGKFITRSAFIACSESVKNEYYKIPFISCFKIEVVHNSFDFKKFVSPLSSEIRNDISMIAYMDKSRDHRTLLYAWVAVANALPDTKLNLIGDGILRTELESLSKELNLRNVFFHGRISDVREILWKTKVYVLSTLSEGFGITLLEALAAGCNVIATDLPACREILKDGLYGTLVKVHDIDCISAAIINNFKEEVSMVKQNDKINYAASFTTIKMIQGYLNVAFNG